MPEYKDTCLTYMDIQGFKNLVLKTYLDDPGTIYAILRQFKQAQYIEPSDFFVKWRPEIVSFSDSIVRGITRSGSGLSDSESIANEVKALRLMQQNLLVWSNEDSDESGVFLRGGMTCGKAYVNIDENMVFGPAMIKAYELENAKRSPFRIAIDQEVFDAHAQMFSVLAETEVVAKDSDGAWFVNYFSVNLFRSWGFWVELERLQKVSHILQAQITRSNEDSAVQQKFSWAAKQHNAAVRASKPLIAAMKNSGLDLDSLLVEPSG